MSRRACVALALSLACCGIAGLATPVAAAPMPAAPVPGEAGPVEFVEDTVSGVDGSVVTLAGGSTWRLEHESHLTPGRKAIIVTLPGGKSGQLFVKGISARVSLVQGVPTRRRGSRGLVVRALGEGGLLELDDRSLWQVSEHDRAGTQRWLLPYAAIVTSDRRYLYNLDEAERVWVSPAR